MRGTNHGSIPPAAETTSQILSVSDQWRIFGYFALLLALLGIGSPHFGLIEIPLSFILKDRLHLSASESANFKLWTGIPFYISFLFGFARDAWNPFRSGDRGLFVAFGLLTSLIYLVFGFAEVSYSMLLVGMVLATSAYLLMSSAWHGLIASVGQRHNMAGQLSVAWNLTGVAVGVVSMLVGGLLSDELAQVALTNAVHALFLLSSLFMLCIAAVGGTSVRSVYGTTECNRARSTSIVQDLRRLAGHRPLYPALLIFVLWNFSPGTQTVLQYYLTDTHNATGMQWGAYNAIESLAFVPTLAIFGFLCVKYSLSRLLWIATLVGIPQMLPLLFIQSVDDALVAAIPIGLMGGMAEAAYISLVIRSCPSGLQGTATMLSSSLVILTSRIANVWGAAVFSEYGFRACVIAAMLVYALILPTLLFVPREVIESPDQRHGSGWRET